MNYVDQKADQLRLNVIEGPIAHEQVKIICSDKLTTSNGSLHAHIIGSSHLLEWENGQGKVIFSEVFACQKINTIKSLFYGDLKQSKSYQAIINGLNYKFTAKKIVWDSEFLAYFKLKKEAEIPKMNIFLDKTFPCEELSDGPDKVKDKQLAITLLFAQNLGNKIQIDSLHAYPKEQQFVISQSFLG